MSALWNWSDLITKINSAALQGGVRLEILPTRHPDYRVIKSADTVIIIHGEHDSKFSWSDSDGNSSDGTAGMISWQIIRRLASAPMTPIEVQLQKKKPRRCAAVTILVLVALLIVAVVVVVMLVR